MRFFVSKIPGTLGIAYWHHKESFGERNKKIITSPGLTSREGPLLEMQIKQKVEIFYS